MASGRYSTEPLLTSVTCLLDGPVSKDIQMHIDNYCVSFLLFQTFVLSGTLINPSSILQLPVFYAHESKQFLK